MLSRCDPRYRPLIVKFCLVRIGLKLVIISDSMQQRWSPGGRPWPRERPRKHILKSLAFVLTSKVNSLPWPQSLKSSKIHLSSAQGQHYFLHCGNLVEKRHKLCGKLAKTVFVFCNWRSAEKFYYYY